MITAIWAIPFVAACVAPFLGTRPRHLLAIGASLVVLVLAATAFVALHTGQSTSEIGGLGYAVEVDAVNGPFLVLSSLLATLTALYGVLIGPKANATWHSTTLLLQACVNGQLLTDDLTWLAMFAAVEVAGVALLVADRGTGAERTAAANSVGRTLGAASS